MNLTTYEPWTFAPRLRGDAGRLLGSMFPGYDLAPEATARRWIPAVDIREEAERFVISADLPGIEAKDVEVSMDNGVLTLKGERKLESTVEGEGGYRRVERQHGTFLRTFSLPDTADAEHVTAKGKNGVIEVVIPKKAAAKPKRIKVSG